MDSFLPAYSDWANKRISLKHNWFDRLADVVRDFPLGGELPASLKNWEKNYKALVQWIKATPDALSPRQLLDLPVFDSWPKEFRDSYQQYLHTQFENCEAGVTGIVKDCLAKLEELNSELTPMLKKDGPVLHDARRARIAHMLDDVAKRLRDLPESLSWPEAVVDDLPLVFVIDDLLGRTGTKKDDGKPALEDQAEAEIGELRRSFCERFHLIDQTALGNTEPVRNPIARAYFSSGQKYGKERGFENDLDVVRKDILRANHDLGANPSWALVIADVLFNTGTPDDSGRGKGESRFGLEEVVPWLKTTFPDLPIVALTTEAGESIIETAHKLGVDYLHRTESTYVDMLIRLARGKRASGPQLRRAMNVPDDFVAEDPKMIDVIIEAWNIAQDDAGRTVLITGEPGTGKERLAQFIHDMSPRSNRTIMFVNCARYSKELADSELFGFYASAFTGAPNQDMPGIFHQADRGTLVLDEFADLDRDVQVKLLRTLEPKRAQHRPVEPRGNRRPTSRLPTEVDVRVICCTNRPISLVREDLRTRVSKVIEIPPLRERPADIVVLAQHFLSSAERINAPGLSLDDGACEFLRTTELTGNARTLEQLLDVASMGKGKRNIIRREDLEAAVSVLGRPRTEEADKNVPAEAHSHSDALVSKLSGSADGKRLAEAISTIITMRGDEKRWLHLSTAEIDALDETMRGSLPEILSTFIEWCFFRADDAPAVVNYMTGQKRKNRAPEDFLKRVIKLDPKICEAIINSPYFPSNPRLKEIINSCNQDRRSKD
ncbi:MAG: sigma 54-interacting transcriptional regulator [Pyrinomonadaceae bacterium]